MTLDYAHLPAPPLSSRQIVIWLLGVVPSLALVITFMDNAATGDPVHSVTRFTAYHWISAAIVLSLLVWFIVVVRTLPKRHRWVVIPVALIWVALNTYGVYLFIDDVRTDVASSYYFSIWQPFGWFGWR